MGPCPLSGFLFFFFYHFFKHVFFLVSFFLFSSLPSSPALSPSLLLSFFLPSFLPPSLSFLQHRKVYCRAEQREGFPSGSVVKNPPANAGVPDLTPGPERCPGERNGNPLPPVFLPEKSHGQRSHVGYSPWGHKELNTT